MEIIQKNGEKNGLFIAQEDGQRIGHISYEWIGPTTLGLMHTIVKPEYLSAHTPSGSLRILNMMM